jgi:F-type H+-transporting ATPase subunit b
LVSTNVLNIALVALVLVVVVRKLGLQNVFHNQQHAISKELNTLYSKRDQAKSDLAAVEERTKALNDEIEQIITQAKVSANEISETIIADAKAEAAAIAERSKQRLEQEEKRLMRTLQEQILSEADLLAKDELKNQNDYAKADSVRQFAQQLSAQRLA